MNRKMIPLRLELTNVLSHKHTVLDFSGITAACIQGENGTGKSSIIEGILYALYGQSTRGPIDDIVKLQETEMSAIYDFEQDQKYYRAARKRVNTGRGKSEMSLGVYNGGGPESLEVIATGDAVTESIIKILGRDFKTLTSSSFLLQGQQERIITATPKERFQVVYNILGLTKYAEYKKLITSKKNRICDRLEVINTEIKRLDGELVNAEALLKEKDNLQKELNELLVKRDWAEKLITEKTSEAAVIQSRLNEFDNIQKQHAEFNNKRSELALKLHDLNGKLPKYPKGKEDCGSLLMKELTLENAAARAAELKAGLNNSESLKRQADSLTSTLNPLKSSIEDARSRAERYGKIFNNKARILSMVEKETAEKETLKSLKSKAEALMNQTETLNIQIRKASEAETEIAVVQGRISADLKEHEAQLKAKRLLLDNAEKEALMLGQTVCRGEGEFSSCVLISKAVESKRSISAIRNEIEALSKKEETEDEKRLSKLQKELVARPSDLKPKFAATESELKAIRGSIEKAEKSLEVLGTWTRQASEIENAEKELFSADAFIKAGQKQAEEIEKQIIAVRAELSKTDSVKEELELIEVVTERLRSLEGGKELEREMERLGRSVKEMEEKLSETEPLKTKLSSLKNELAGLNEELVRVKDSGAETFGKITVIEVKAEQNQKEMEKLNKHREEADTLKEGIRVREVLEECCDKIPFIILDNVLPIVEEEANKVLERISNTGMRMEFKTDKVTKTTKTVKDVLDIEVSDIVGERPILTFSGGEKTRLILALIVGLAEISSRKAGVKINTLVIDEPSGLDENGLSDFGHCVTRLVDEGFFKKILLMAHDKKLLDVFDQKILVTKEGTSSKVTVQI